MSTPLATAQTARHPLTLALKARLETVTRLTVHVGEVRGTPATLPDDSGRVAPYAVIYPGPGLPDPNPSLSAVPADFLWSCQTTLVAGYSEDLDALLDDVVPLLNLWCPGTAVAGLDCGHLRPADGFDPGAYQRDRDVEPHRFFVPLLWQLHVVTAAVPSSTA